MSYGFSIGYCVRADQLKNVQQGPGQDDNRSTTTGIFVQSNNKFYLWDKDHSRSELSVVGGSWSGWSSNRVGFEFVMEFDFVGNAFNLYDKKQHRKLLQIERIPKHSVLPIFTLLNENDEIEIVECALL